MIAKIYIRKKASFHLQRCNFNPKARLSKYFMYYIQFLPPQTCVASKSCSQLVQVFKQRVELISIFVKGYTKASSLKLYSSNFILHLGKRNARKIRIPYFYHICQIGRQKKFPKEALFVLAQDWPKLAQMRKYFKRLESPKNLGIYIYIYRDYW